MAFLIIGPSLEVVLTYLMIGIVIAWNLYILWTIFKNKRDIVELKEELRRLKRLDFLKER